MNGSSGMNPLNIHPELCTDKQIGKLAKFYLYNIRSLYFFMCLKNMLDWLVKRCNKYFSIPCLKVRLKKTISQR